MKPTSASSSKTPSHGPTPTSRKRPRPKRPAPLNMTRPPVTSLPTSFYHHRAPDSVPHPRDPGVWKNDPRSGASSRRGQRRRYNEDAVFAVPRIGLYGVCDGHGADHRTPVFASHKVSDVLPKFIADGMSMKDAFAKSDRSVCALYDSNSFVGTTVSLVQVVNTKRARSLLVAHVGDSRCMIIDAAGVPHTLTVDHTPQRLDESDRIEKQGGIILNGRVNGVLAVTRAIGDKSIKRFVPSTPDLLEYPLSRNDQLVVIATDGLWDVMTDKDVANFLTALPQTPGAVAVPHDLTKAADLLLEKAAHRGSRDDISIVLVDVRAR